MQRYTIGSTSRVVSVLLSLCVSGGHAFAADVTAVSEDRLWQAVSRVPKAQVQAQPWVRPSVFQGVQLDQQALTAALAAAPLEFTDRARQAPLEITLPMPDGTFSRFRIVESPIMEPGLAAKFPEIKTYGGQGIDDPAATVRLDWGPAGLHAQVLSPRGTVYIDPYTKGDRGFYASYYSRNNGKSLQGLRCLTEPDVLEQDGPRAGPAGRTSGETLRSYRVAVGVTGEYTQFHGGTVAEGLNGIAVTINRISGILEVEAAVRLILVANNDLVVFTDGATDPYSNNDVIANLSENPTVLNALIGGSNYDIGHVFSTGGGGGVASLRVPCTVSKARGASGTTSPIGEGFALLVAHEMGHQFGANHTFNGVNGNCSPSNRNWFTAYEVGSGSTIMSYYGICGGNDNLLGGKESVYHHESQREIVGFVSGYTGSSCAVETATGNNPPVVDAGPDYFIPKETAFILTASGSDPDLDSITYCWEERDLGPAQQAGGMEDNGSSPLFRSFAPTVAAWRMFPRLLDIVNNTTTIGEVLPSRGRTLDFRVLVRDNRVGGGGVGQDDMTVFVVGGAGPFRVTSPNSPVLWAGTRTVTWDVAGTDDEFIAVSEVNILLSTNGGFTFPTELAMNTPNDGAEEVILPVIQSGSARIKVEAVGHIFFDISDVNFAVDMYNPPAQAPSPHHIKKNRYVSFSPNNPGANIAIEVSMTDGPGATGALGWVGAPFDAGCFEDDGTPTGRPCSGEFVARVVHDPVFREWPEEVVHVGDCEVVPMAVYELRASGDGVVLGPPFEVVTILKPDVKFFGDIVGIFVGIYSQPNGFVNITDIQALLFCMQATDSAPPLTWCDLHGLGIGSPPNFLANVSDLQQILKGNQGLTFLDANPDNRDPADCP